LEEALPATAWLLSGGCVRPQKEPVLKTGRTPMLVLEDRDAAASKREQEVDAAAAKMAAEIVARTPAAAPASNGAAKANGALNGHAPHLNGSRPPQAPQAPQHVAPVVPAAFANGGAGTMEVLMAYQDTMRQFISVQERIMT